MDKQAVCWKMLGLERGRLVRERTTFLRSKAESSGGLLHCIQMQYLFNMLHRSVKQMACCFQSTWVLWWEMEGRTAMDSRSHADLRSRSHTDMQTCSHVVAVLQSPRFANSRSCNHRGCRLAVTQPCSHAGSQSHKLNPYSLDFHPHGHLFTGWDCDWESFHLLCCTSPYCECSVGHFRR